MLMCWRWFGGLWPAADKAVGSLQSTWSPCVAASTASMEPLALRLLGH